MLKLYHTAQSRSTRPRWLLEEIGAPYELVRISMKDNQHKSPEYLRVHPHGQLPALVDGDLTLMESAAICLHLADKFPDAQLAPPPGTPERARYYQWMVYTIGTLEPPVLDVFLNTIQLPEAERSAAKAESGRARFAEVAKVISAALGAQPYLLGDRFSAADIMIGSTLGWCSFMGLLDGQPVLSTYVERLVQRPAYQRAGAD
ncbi:MAG: glutathione S-transferase family protein [Deltaproteobacteria bacterium]|nr:glutathione S-transferase family protein [Deltaproteobacteria bacterium]